MCVCLCVRVCKSTQCQQPLSLKDFHHNLLPTVLNFNQNQIKILGVSTTLIYLLFILQSHFCLLESPHQGHQGPLNCQILWALFSLSLAFGPMASDILEMSLFGFYDSLSFCVPSCTIHFLPFLLSEIYLCSDLFHSSHWYPPISW